MVFGEDFGVGHVDLFFESVGHARGERDSHVEVFGQGDARGAGGRSIATGTVCDGENDEDFRGFVVVVGGADS